MKIGSERIANYFIVGFWAASIQIVLVGHEFYTNRDNGTRNRPCIEWKWQRSLATCAFHARSCTIFEHVCPLQTAGSAIQYPSCKENANFARPSPKKPAIIWSTVSVLLIIDRRWLCQNDWLSDASAASSSPNRERWSCPSVVGLSLVISCWYLDCKSGVCAQFRAHPWGWRCSEPLGQVMQWYSTDCCTLHQFIVT